MLQCETKLQKCIRMGIITFKTLIWGGISSDIRSEITFYGSACFFALKLNFQPYIRPFTSSSENFEYSYLAS